MKPHSSEVALRRYAGAQSIAWLLEIADGEEAWRAASRALSFGGNPFPDSIAETPKWEMHPRDELGVGGIIGSSASVRVADVTGGDASFREWITARDPLGLTARLTLLWLDEPNAPVADDAVVMLDGIVTGVQLECSAVRILMRDRLGARLALQACRVLTRTMIGNEFSPLLGEPLPLAFGSHVNQTIAPLRSGALTRLAEAISNTDDVIPVLSLEGFPDSGTAQIGHELIIYSSVDLTNRTLGTAADPAMRGGGATAHGSGSRVRAVPAGGFQWIVADHECEAIGAVRADGVDLDSADWNAELRDIGGIEAQIVTMDQWPVVLGELANKITVDFEGWPAPVTGALENPADLIELLITQARFAALDSAMPDSASLDAVRDDLADHDYRFSRIIASHATLGELLQSAVRESAVWIRSGGGVITFARAKVSPHAADALESLDETRALDPDASLDLTPSDALQLHDRLELYSSTGALGFVRAAGALSDPALAPLCETLDWLAPDAATAWRDLGTRLWPQVSESYSRHAQSFPLGAVLLEPGDSVLITHGPLELDRVPAWMERVKLDGPKASGRATITAIGPEAGHVCWFVDAQTYLRHSAFCRRLLAVVAGRPVMSVTRSGDIFICGTLTEGGLTSPPTLPAPVHRIGDDLYLGAGSSGSYTAFARLDPGGNLELCGTLAEESALTFTTPDACISSNDSRFYLSPNFRDPAFEYRPGTQILHLKGNLAENFPM